ncbi:Alpha/Beta hydrolase protein [Butyriboletus roseoflavus]|nr:Alpha/Beta hydrolase protein [Butyriboletus roseoflavus]
MDESTHESTLALPGGRTLAYATSGNPHSTTVLLYLHGSFTVGQTSKVSRAIALKDIHYISPTLPGWGNTSPPSPPTPYVDCLTSDMTALLDHLYPENGRDIKLYVSGGSFGTVPAQILYGAPYDKFPYGRCIVGVLLMGAVPPFRYHKDYAKHMTWSSYFMTGPITQWLPFPNLVVHLVKFWMMTQMSTVDNAEKFFQGFVFDKMDEAEKEEYAQWKAKGGIAEGEAERKFATNAVRSVANSWEGFRFMPLILHSDWGFRPDALDEEHSRPFVMLVTSSGDKEAPEAWTQYLAVTYKNTKVKTLRGGHISVLYHLGDVLEEFLAGVE